MLNAAKQYRLSIFGSGRTGEATPFYFVMPTAVTDFWVASSSAQTSVNHQANLDGVIRVLKILINNLRATVR